MKKQLLLAAFSIAALASTAQTVVTDTVIMGASYVNQVWYSLPNDEQGSQAKNNWDLAFRTSGSMGSTIMVNHSGGGSIWVYPKGAKGAWGSIDTTGLSKWSAQYNSETAWVGALGRYTDPANDYDLGWGIYDMGSHIVTGDSVYIIKTQTGKFKKLIIDKLASSVYTFTYANLDGTDSTTSTIAKSTYANKNFGYFNLDTKTAVDREPVKDNWDLVFGQYSTGDYLATMGLPGYTVTGILVNDTLKIAKAKVDPAIRAGYKTYSAHTFSKDINGIGWNWKSYDGTAYKVSDSTVYFIRRNNGDIWKLILTGFSSTTGSVMFSKERLSSVSINETAKSKTTLALSPNPVRNGQQTNIVYNFETSVNDAVFNIYDMMGRQVMTQPLEKTAGLHAYTFDASRLNAGTYIVTVVADNELTQQKLIVQ